MTVLKDKQHQIPSYQTIHGLPEGQDARFLADRAREASRQKQVIVHVAMDESRISALAGCLSFFTPDVEVVLFPAWDCLPYDRVSPHTDIMAGRIAALSRLLEWKSDGLFKPRIILTSVNAIVQRVMPPETLVASQLVALKGGTLSLVDLGRFLANNGYVRTDTVREAGEFAIRGDIVDIFPPSYEAPVRIDLFGDDIESIRSFDPSSQMTTGILDRFELRPVTEFFLDEESIARFRSGYRDMFGVSSASNPLYVAVSEGRRHAGMEHWLSLFHARLTTIFEYINHPLMSFDGQAEQSRNERLSQTFDFYKARVTLDDSIRARKQKKQTSDVSLTGVAYHPLPPEKLYISDEEFQEMIKGAKPIILNPFLSPDEAYRNTAKRARDFSDIRANPQANVFIELSKYIKSLQSEDKRVLIACYSQGSRERFKVMMEEGGAGLPYPIDTWHQVTKLQPFQVGSVILHLEHGFVADDIAVITEQDILGDRLARKSGKRKRADNFLKEVGALAVGDLVVHVDHGVGRFEGLETLKAGGLLHDCLKITYAGGDRLFVPVENIDLLTRFGNSDGLTELDKLGGAGWQARKSRVKKDLMKMAEGLLAIAAERLLSEADIIEIDAGHYGEFVSKFPYQETEDQLRAIEDTLSDMKSGKPMDRLICGDVGFGKTEIALRAAYVAAKTGAQVVVVAPTTLLARQHFVNFGRRFAEMGMRVEQLSRLVTSKEAKIVKDGLADGSVRIVIGTHALLAKDIKFSGLGLVVVDEEQRFGVKQKERLKELKSHVHVLTLSATPIPRTLQLALTGVRDMSLIATPPVDRLAIRTFVMPFDPLVVREAILREHYRGGQSFYVCPRIKDMEELEQQLHELVPEVKIISAHGQLTPTELEDRMNAFCDGQYGILLATNIIESGLDIPSANTIIIHRADMFGLSQLYQIRGRVGRAKIRAYAYLTYPQNMILSDDAQKRLEIFETLDSLGAGFQLASHDLDIRGAGNLLGDEQSGHIKEVGIELYQQMLEDAVSEARAGGIFDKKSVTDHEWSPTLNLGMSVLIPEKYIEDLGIRMSLYRRLGELISDEDIDSFAAELVDRFGAMPDEVSNLLEIVRIKMYCKRARIVQFDAGPKGAIIRFYQDSPSHPEKLFAWMAERPSTVKIRPDQKLVILRTWDAVKDRVKGARQIASELSVLV
jgi:transcription-repair coupling factor (superfamily II helicase)